MLRKIVNVLVTQQERPLEEKLFNSIALISFTATFLFTLNAIFVIRDRPIIIADALATVLIFVIYYFSRFKDNYRAAFPLFGLLVLVVINSVWFTTGGYDSSNGYIYLIITIVLIILTSKVTRLILMGVFVINILSLFLIEYYYPDISNEYDKTTNLINHAVSLILCMFIVLFIVSRLKDNYDNEQNKVIHRNRELKKLNREIEDQNTKLEQQHEELAAQRDKLEDQFKIIQKQNQKLIKYSETLEDTVNERTKQLSNLNSDLVKQNQKLEQYTFTLAHNLKAPVSRLLGLINILDHNPKDEAGILETVPHIKTSAVHLDEIISELNNLISIEKGVEVAFEDIHVKSEINFAIGVLKEEIQHKKGVISIDLPENFKIHGIKAYFQSICYNLISNSLKYSDPGKIPIINISVEHERDCLLLKFRDNGIGIDLAAVGEKLFKLYQRFHEGYQGKGFGLYLTKLQTEAMGGKISVESKVLEGSTFSLTFPVIN